MRKLTVILLTVVVGITAALGMTGCKKKYRDKDWIDTYCVFQISMHNIEVKVNLGEEETVTLSYLKTNYFGIEYRIYRVYRGNRILETDVRGDYGVANLLGSTQTFWSCDYQTPDGIEIATLKLVIGGQ